MEMSRAYRWRRGLVGRCSGRAVKAARLKAAAACISAAATTRRGVLAGFGVKGWARWWRRRDRERREAE
jgi:hypothetical protein